MLDAIKPLLDSDLVNEDTRAAIQEQWEAKMGEVKTQVTAELREEFARRYEHDKSTMVEALDKMVTDTLTEELAQVAEEKKKLAEDRAKFVARMKETSGTFDKFLVGQLSEEIKELHGDRTAQAAVVNRLEKFVVSQLAEEIQDFQQDRQDVHNTKVNLVKEARSQFAELKKNFVEKSSEIVKEAVQKNLTSELTQLKEDIQSAKENTFGRKIFEAFASEFGSSYLNENQEIRKLEAKVTEIEGQLTEANSAIAEKSQIIESKENEVKAITESVNRKEVMGDLLSKLNKEKGAIMRDLLESVQTEKLQSAFDRYIPAVLDGAKTKIKEDKVIVNESRKEVSGNKQTKTQPAIQEVDDSNIIDIRRLAGLK